MGIWFRDSLIEKYLIADGVCKKFNYLGELIEESHPLTPDITSSAKPVSIVSILCTISTDAYAEVLAIRGNKCYRVGLRIGVDQLTSRFIEVKGFLAYLKRSGTFNGLYYIQMFFVYPEGYDVCNLVKNIVGGR